MASFEEILNKPTSEIKAPLPYPVGHYHCIVDGPFEPGKSSQKGTDFLRAKYKIIAPGDDVDQRMAAEQQVVGKLIYQDHYITDNEVTQNMFKEFLVDTLGIDNDGEKKSLKELMSEAPGKQLIVELKHQVSQDGKRAFHRVNSTAHV
jgi:Protein of unknown function (DUF669)